MGQTFRLNCMNELKSRVSSALLPPVRAVPKDFFCADKKLTQTFVVVQIICRCADHLHENPFHGLCTSEHGCSRILIAISLNGWVTVTTLKLFGHTCCHDVDEVDILI